MVEPLSVLSTIMLLYGATNATKRTFIKQPNVLGDKLISVISQLKTIENKIDERVMTEMVSGVGLLMDAMNISSAGELSGEKKGLRDEQLLLARNRFVNLVSMDKDGTTKNISNRYFRVAGFWGNFHYFALRGDPKMAMQQPLLCAKEHPLLAVHVFGPTFFGKQIHVQVEELIERRKGMQCKDEKSLESHIQNIIRKDKHKEMKSTAKYVGTVAGGGALGMGAYVLVSLIWPPAAVVAAGATMLNVIQNANQAKTSNEDMSKDEIDKLRADMTAVISEEKKLSDAIIMGSTKAYQELRNLTPTGLDRLAHAAR